MECDEVLSFTRSKRNDVEERIKQLRRIKSVLDELIEECEENDDYDYCPILDSLTVEEPKNGEDRSSRA